MLSGLEKTYLDESFNTVVQRVALNRSDENVFALFQQYCGRIPTREIERLRRVHTAQMAQLDATHPPTAHRVAFLQAHHVADAKVILIEQEAQQIAHGLQRLEPSMQRTLIDEYKSQLYY